VRAGEPESHCGEEDATKGEGEKQLLRNQALDPEGPQCGAKNRRVVLPQTLLAHALPQLRELRWENASARIKEGATLGSAGAVRHPAGEKCLGPGVEPRQRHRIVMCDPHQRDRKMPRLPERIADEAAQIPGPGEVALLRHRLQTSGMREPTGGERGV